MCLISNPSFAGWSMELHLYTQHYVDFIQQSPNEKNYGIGFRYQFSENWAALIGEYANSLPSHKLECKASCTWEPENIDSHYLSFERFLAGGTNYKFGVGLGVADGYKDFVDESGNRFHTGSDFQIMAGPYLNIGDQYSIKLRYMFQVASLGMQYDF